jgi:hypothetical protein
MVLIDFLKKQKASFWLLLSSFILCLAAFIVYLVNGAAPGYFQGSSDPTVIECSVFALIFLLALLPLEQLHLPGLGCKILDLVMDALIIAAPVLMLTALLTFVGDRAQGLAYIFGADPNTLSEIQTPANMSSAFTAIAGFVLFGIAFLIGAVGSFFRLPKDAVGKAKKA